MKVVLFCGGQGMRVRDHDGAVPKPMVNIGNRPILWHLMKYYAYFGHKEFILCLGYKADVIKDYFLNYKEWMSNDLVLRDGGRDIQLLSSDIDDWEITFADTGTQATIGERLLAVRSHLADDEMFLANYADGLSDLWLPAQLDGFEASDAIASFMVVHSPQSFHVARIDDDGMCAAIEPLADSAIWFNAGYFAFRREIFDYIRPGDELVVEPFQRLIAERRLIGIPVRGLLAGDGHVQGPAARSRRGTSRAMPRGRSGDRSPRARPPRPADAMLTIGEGGLALARVLCLGAHSDDIEIGGGGTLLKLLALHPAIAVDWVVLQRRGRPRERGARQRRALPRPTARRGSASSRFRERYLPYDPAVKEYFDQLGREATPDLVLCPWQGDAHQDHRLVAELAAEHVPRPADPGVRDPEVRRRPGEAVGVRPPVDGTGRSEDRRPGRELPEPARPAVVRRGDIPCSHASPRHRESRPGRLCGSVPLPETGARMKLVMTGTDGYIGSVMADHLMAEGHEVTGIDTGFYRSGWLFDGVRRIPRTITKDVREITVDDLRGADAIVHLAELSNDPLGQLAPNVTYEINHQGSVRLARLGREAGVTRFVYMSSCSVYGIGSDAPVTEESPVNPQTAYAECKVLVERDVGAMAGDDFHPTFLRNATAFGASPRMRFDIVLNNLMGIAWTTGEVANDVRRLALATARPHPRHLGRRRRGAASAGRSHPRSDPQRGQRGAELPRARDRGDRGRRGPRLHHHVRPRERRQPELPRPLRQDR